MESWIPEINLKKNDWIVEALQKLETWDSFLKLEKHSDILNFYSEMKKLYFESNLKLGT